MFLPDGAKKLLSTSPYSILEPDMQQETQTADSTADP